LPTDPIPVPVRHPGGCLQPVLLRGRVDHIDGATGELLHRYTTIHEPGGVLPIACKTRRASRCPPCAEVYRADTYQLIRAGLTGGKGIPATVAQHPSVFTTLTAPSFGPVHTCQERDGKLLACHPRRNAGTSPHGVRMSCTQKHGAMTTSSANRCARTATTTPTRSCSTPAPPNCGGASPSPCARTLARHAGFTRKAFTAQARLSYAKVAEYQRRGVVHFHAIIRLDGPHGPATTPPAWATLTLLTEATGQVARTVHVETPTLRGMPARTLAWGRELDTRPVTTTGELTDSKVAAYVAKYATKAAECTGTRDRRITPAYQLAELPVRDHARRHIAECLRLAKLPAFEALHLAAWAHMLGFSGHFSTKSRAYSTTSAHSAPTARLPARRRNNRWSPARPRRRRHAQRHRLDLRRTRLPDWIDSHAMEIKPRTLHDYRSCIRLYVTPRIGKLPIQAVRPSTITKLYRELLTSGGLDGKPLAVATVTHLRGAAEGLPRRRDR
jgi:hypothetical protein